MKISLPIRASDRGFLSEAEIQGCLRQLPLKTKVIVLINNCNKKNLIKILKKMFVRIDEPIGIRGKATPNADNPANLTVEFDKSRF